MTKSRINFYLQYCLPLVLAFFLFRSKSSGPVCECARAKQLHNSEVVVVKGQTFLLPTVITVKRNKNKKLIRMSVPQGSAKVVSHNLDKGCNRDPALIAAHNNSGRERLDHLLFLYTTDFHIEQTKKLYFVCARVYVCAFTIFVLQHQLKNICHV